VVDQYLTILQTTNDCIGKLMHVLTTKRVCKR